jgi:hypothetical protein
MQLCCQKKFHLRSLFVTFHASLSMWNTQLTKFRVWLTAFIYKSKSKLEEPKRRRSLMLFEKVDQEKLDVPIYYNKV